MKFDLEGLMTVAQASEMLGISTQAIEKAIKNREMREIRIDCHVSITKSSKCL
jgi:excisionase family DNA binding protein